jgi:hypothetical protein
VLAGAGLPFLSVADGAPLVYRLLGITRIAGIGSNPPLISYFFQHPWTLGFPLAVAALLVALENGEAGGRRAALGLLVLCLANVQFVLFCALPPTLVAMEAFGGRPIAWRRAGHLALVLAVPMLLATQLGGFFARTPSPGGLTLELHPGIVGSSFGIFEWHVATYGVLLPLGVIGIAMARRLRVPLACLTVGGLAIINLVRYSYSADIRKFGILVSFALAVAAAFPLAWLRARRGLAARALFVALLVLGTAGGFTFWGVLATRAPGIPTLTFHERPFRLERADAECVAWLRSRVAADEIVYRNPDYTNAYAFWGGFGQPWIDSMATRFGFEPQRIEARQWLLEVHPDDPAAWARQGIVWFVLDPTDTVLRAHLGRWVEAGTARQVATFGDREIFRLEPWATAQGGATATKR